jgi:D-3-phosphoglycerate dehydrogenase / 2-oxoglutarate reductase
VKRIVVLDAGYSDYSYEESRFKESGYAFEIYSGSSTRRSEKIAFARDAVGALVRGTLVDDTFFAALPALRALVRYGVGYDNVDVQSATKHGVKVANVQGYANDSVSDHAMSLMYACTRALPFARLRGVKFGAPPRTPMPELKDLTLGIIGLGRIGGRLAEKAIFLFNKVIAVDPYISNCRFLRLGVVKTDLETLLKTSHVISIHCNLTAETTCLFNSQAFQHMGCRPVLINTARGPIVEERALLRALDAGVLHSAGLDVYWKEPASGLSARLARHPLVLATKHYAWYSENAARDLQRRATENMLALLQGESPDDCLNP